MAGRGGQLTVAVTADHGDDPVDQVAQAVGELVVGPGDEPRHGEVGVAHPRHLAQQPPAHRVGAVLRGQRGRLERARTAGAGIEGRGAGAGLADLPAGGGQVVVHEDAGRQLLPGRQQHGRPVDGVKPQHALAKHVDPVPWSGPPAPVGLVTGWADLAVAQRRHVVAQRVEPHVDNLARVAGHRDAPAAGPVGGPRHREVRQPAVDEPEHLVAAPGGLDPQPAGGDRLPQRRGVAGQPEEPVLLADLLRFRPVFGAAAVAQLGRTVELLTAGAVQAGVLLPVQVRRAGPPERLDAGPVPGVAAGADEVVHAQRQRTAERTERLGVAVDELPHPQSGGASREHVLQRVVVGPRLEPDRVAAPAVVAGQHVGLDELERVPDVRARVHVGDGRGDVGCGHRSLLAGAPSANTTSRPHRRASERNVRTRQRPRARGIITCCP